LQRLRAYALTDNVVHSVRSACEPRLLTSDNVPSSVLDILDDVTSSIMNLKDNETKAFRVLKKGLAYCWSIALVACPEKGKKPFEKWMGCRDKNVIWIMKENLQKNRLLKMDEAWVSNQMAKLKSRL